MDDGIEKFWDEKIEQIEDPHWHVFSYEDGSTQFVCSDCHETIWEGREVVYVDTEGGRAQAQYSKSEDTFVCVASESNMGSPSDFSTFEKIPPYIKNETTETVLWALLSGWWFSLTGKQIETEQEFEAEFFLGLIKNIDTKVGETQEKDIEDYELEDYINIGIKKLLSD